MGNETNNVLKILEAFTQSYIKKTKDIIDFKFGFIVDEVFYIVNIKCDGEFEVKEEDREDIFSFVTDSVTLNKLFAQEITGMTAISRANWKDAAPLDFVNYDKIPENINPLRFVFSYFILGEPEKIIIDKDHARIVHGGYAIPMIYDEGIRTAWYRVEKGMIINEREEDQFNPFPTFVIAKKGKGMIKIGLKEYAFQDGDGYYIPKDTAHSFWTENEEGFEFIIIMYGEEA